MLLTKKRTLSSSSSSIHFHLSCIFARQVRGHDQDIAIFSDLAMRSLRNQDTPDIANNRRDAVSPSSGIFTKTCGGSLSKVAIGGRGPRLQAKCCTLVTSIRMRFAPDRGLNSLHMQVNNTIKILMVPFFLIRPRIPTSKQEIHIVFNPKIMTRRRPILSTNRMTGMIDARVIQLLMITTRKGSSMPAAL